MGDYAWKGVNLGNWLVLEKWMSPELFDGVDAEDEYHFTRALPQQEYQRRITQHRKEFITNHDFALIAALGYNAVRIPVPFFIFGDRPPYAGCLEELDLAFDWAEEFGLKVMIDLHTVPGSQNGFDNGGICGVCRWAKQPEEMEFALSVLERLARRYGRRDGLFGIEALNEPVIEKDGKSWQEINRYPSVEPEMEKDSAPIPLPVLRQFYIDAYRRMRPYLAEDKYFVFHDAFDMLLWKDFMREEEFHHVALDAHLYYSIAERQGAEKTLEGSIRAAEEVFGRQIEEMSRYFQVICGEWCLSSGYTSGLPEGKEKEEAYRILAQCQQKAWEKGFGSFFWSYKLSNLQKNLYCWDAGKCHGKAWMP